MVCKKMHENYPFDSLEVPPHPPTPITNRVFQFKKS